jgi:hypothetical protein
METIEGGNPPSLFYANSGAGGGVNIRDKPQMILGGGWEKITLNGDGVGFPNNFALQIQHQSCILALRKARG